MMKYKSLRGGIPLLLLITIILLFPFGAVAQSPPPKLETLTVSLWPEYDRPEVLIIYRGQLSADTELPAQLTFRLPGYIDRMHAVAAVLNGVLTDTPHELTGEGNDVLLTFSAPSANIQFEYYDSVMLNKQEQTRKFTFDFSAPYDIGMAIFEVQQPVQTESFSLVPAPNDTSPGDDDLMYSTIGVPNMAPDDPFTLSATYRRNTSQLSAGSQSSGRPFDIAAVTEGSSSGNLYFFYALIAAGVVLVLYWWREVMRRSSSPKSSRGRVRLKHSQTGRSRRSRVAESPGLFCYNCGATLQEDANFCHACGAERR